MIFALQDDLATMVDEVNQAEMKNELSAVERRLKREIHGHEKALVLAKRRLLRVRRLMAADQGVGQITEVRG